MNPPSRSAGSEFGMLGAEDPAAVASATVMPMLSRPFLVSPAAAT